MSQGLNIQRIHSPRRAALLLSRKANLVGPLPSRAARDKSRVLFDTMSYRTSLVSQATTNQRCPFSPRTRPAGNA